MSGISINKAIVATFLLYGAVVLPFPSAGCSSEGEKREHYSGR
jgi:hypothetical protein